MWILICRTGSNDNFNERNVAVFSNEKQANDYMQKCDSLGRTLFKESKEKFTNEYHIDLPHSLDPSFYVDDGWFDYIIQEVKYIETL